MAACRLWARGRVPRVPRDAPGRDDPRPAQAGDYHRYRRPISVHSQPPLPEHDPDLRRHLSTRRRAPARPVAPHSSAPDAARRNRARGTLPGAKVRRRVHRVQGKDAALDLNEKDNLLPHGDTLPQVAPTAWIAPGACVIGDVHLGEESSVWYGAVLRGDTEPIRIGAMTNVQDGCVLHADPGYPAVVGDGCVLGHNAVVHGCQIGDDCLVGMGCTILNGAKIGAGSIVAAGAVVPEGREFLPHSLIVGLPAKRVGDVSEELAAEIARGATEYVERAAAHRESLEGRA